MFFKRKKKEASEKKPNATISLRDIMSGAKQHQSNISATSKFEIGHSRRKGKKGDVRLTKKEQKRLAEEQKKENDKPFSIFSLSSIKRAVSKLIWSKLSDKTKLDLQQRAIKKQRSK
nr:hypothetical protein [Vibrio splendidus]MCC4882498.1 hypothetical protein [Vibrio splendidus]